MGAATLALGLATYSVVGRLTAPPEAPVPEPAATGASPAAPARAEPEPVSSRPAASPAPAAPARAPAAPPEPAPAVGAGSLLVESRPSGAAVYLNNRRVGETPLVLPDVPAGSGVVRLERDGYRPWVTSVDVVAGRRVRVAASLEGARAR